MSLESATSEDFLRTLEIWLQSESELLILIRYSSAAGNKDFELYSSFALLQERLRQLPASTCVTAFRNPQLQLRGIVDGEFIGKCLRSVPDGAEYVVVETVPTTLAGFLHFDFTAGESRAELREALESRIGKSVAVGKYPPWQKESADVISAYVPTRDGKVKRGVY